LGHPVHAFYKGKDEKMLRPTEIVGPYALTFSVINADRVLVWPTKAKVPL